MTTSPSVALPHSVNEGQQSVSVSTTSAATTNPIGATQAIVHSSVECFLMAGSNPTATVAAGMPIPANQLIPISGLKPDDKIAAIAASGSGTLNIRPAG